MLSDIPDCERDASEKPSRHEAGAGAKEPKGSGKLKLLSLNSLDRRTAAFQRTKQLIVDIENDLGGSDRLSTGERQLVQRAACLSAVLEDQEVRWLSGQEMDPGTYTTTINALRRVLETVGLRRVPKNVPDLQAYLSARKAG